jgi:hypothetical protein
MQRWMPLAAAALVGLSVGAYGGDASATGTTVSVDTPPATTPAGTNSSGKGSNQTLPDNKGTRTAVGPSPAVRDD